MTVVQQDAFHTNVDIERRKSALNKAPPEMKRVDSLALFDAASATVAEGSKHLSIHRRKTVEAVMEKSTNIEKVTHRTIVQLIFRSYLQKHFYVLLYFYM